MTQSVILFIENVIIENEIPIDSKKEIQNLIGNSKDVQRFVSLSMKVARERNITPQEKVEMSSLSKKEDVIDFLEKSEEIGKRIGWLRGSKYGGLIGGFLGIVVGLPLALTNFVFFAVLGAVAGGYIGGQVLSTILGIKNRNDASLSLKNNQKYKQPVIEEDDIP